MAALPGGRLVVHFTNRKNAPFLFSTRIGTPPEEPAVVQRVAAAEQVFVPAIALGELYYGARKSARAEANIARVDEFATAAAVLACDAVTAQQYGRIKDDLRAKGRPIPENDIWIAAVASQNGLTVVSRDDHFAEVADLAIEVW